MNNTYKKLIRELAKTTARINGITTNLKKHAGLMKEYELELYESLEWFPDLSLEERLKNFNKFVKSLSETQITSDIEKYINFINSFIVNIKDENAIIEKLEIKLEEAKDEEAIVKEKIEKQKQINNAITRYNLANAVLGPESPFGPEAMSRRIGKMPKKSKNSKKKSKMPEKSEKKKKVIMKKNHQRHIVMKNNIN